MNSTMPRWEPFRGLNTLHEQVNRLFEDSFARSRAGQAELASWAPAVDIYETENELVVKADLPEVQEKDIDVRVENNTLTIRGERKFSNEVHEDNYLRVERAHGTVRLSFSLPNAVDTEAHNGDH